MWRDGGERLVDALSFLLAITIESPLFFTFVEVISYKW